MNRRAHFVAAACLAVAAHALTVWAIPRLIMARVISMSTTETNAAGSFLPPPTDHTSRRIVMPSPDLLYATCSLALADGPARVTFEGRYARYWSIALYATNSDNFFVIGDRQSEGRSVDLRIVGPTNSSRDKRTIRAPSERVFLLMRLLVNDDPAVLAEAERARRTLRCEPETKA